MKCGLIRSEQATFGIAVPGWDACRIGWNSRYEWGFGVSNLVGLGLFAPTLLLVMSGFGTGIFAVTGFWEGWNDDGDGLFLCKSPASGSSLRLGRDAGLEEAA